MCLFCLIKKTHINNKIKKLTVIFSSSTFSVYLIQEQLIVRTLLWSKNLNQIIYIVDYYVYL